MDESQIASTSERVSRWDVHSPPAVERASSNTAVNASHLQGWSYGHLAAITLGLQCNNLGDFYRTADLIQHCDANFEPFKDRHLVELARAQAVGTYEDLPLRRMLR